jgi:hypothetical protein
VFFYASRGYNYFKKKTIDLYSLLCSPLLSMRTNHIEIKRMERDTESSTERAWTGTHEVRGMESSMPVGSFRYRETSSLTISHI